MGIIEATDREILQDAGKVTAEIAKAHAEAEFEKYRISQDRLYESDFDKVIKQIETDDSRGGQIMAKAKKQAKKTAMRV